ncbi:hypothetical protein J2S57_002129 [Kineosporia succinea]|uniref:Uncharacterized protein n=1 Tax=Kineosporia succinea TaxID=84632 RepID=A0ABT9P2C3_9ACTN|nr:hypothetical protein [Kineosporia succinea]
MVSRREELKLFAVVNDPAEHEGCPGQGEDSGHRTRSALPGLLRLRSDGSRWLPVDSYLARSTAYSQGLEAPASPPGAMGRVLVLALLSPSQSSKCVSRETPVGHLPAARLTADTLTTRPDCASPQSCNSLRPIRAPVAISKPMTRQADRPQPPRLSAVPQRRFMRDRRRSPRPRSRRRSRSRTSGPNVGRRRPPQISSYIQNPAWQFDYPCMAYRCASRPPAPRHYGIAGPAKT